MADINISLSTNARQDARLAEILAYENAGRVADGLEPFATVDALLKFWIVDTAQARIATIEAEEASEVYSDYLEASEAIQAQVRALLV